MKKTLKRFITALLAALMIMSLLVACGNNNEDEGGDKTDLGLETGTEQDPKLPAKDYQEYEFTFITNAGSSYNVGYLVSDAEEEGETLDDAIFRRNQLIEEKYNIKIVHITTPDIVNEVRTQIKAGLTDFDVIVASGRNLSTMARENVLYNLLDVETFNLDHTYWDQNANEQLRMGDKLYYTNCALNISTIGFCVFFNKQLVEDYQLTSPYEYIENNEWTMDNWAQMVNSISRDMNSDGAMTEFDQYGSLMEHHNVRMFLYASGIRATTNDESGYPQLTLMSNKDKVVDICAKLKEVFSNDSTCYCMTCANISFPDNYAHKYAYLRYLFTQDLYLFHYQSEGAMSAFAEMESDFGLIPFPKYNSAQEKYQTMYPVNNHLVALPSVIEDIERTGAIVEDMNYYSSFVLEPVWFDTLLARRYARDDESEASLRLLRDNCVYDIGAFYDFGGVLSIIGSDPKTLNINRQYDKLEKSILNDIKRVYADFSKDNK